MSSLDERSQYLPWSWEITPLDPASSDCPSPLHILLTYLLVTTLTTILGFIFGASPIMRKLTCGLFGKKESRSWLGMWLLQLALHFGADLAVAALTIHAAGYNEDQMPAFWDLALFYTSRPRMAWIPLAMLVGLGPWKSVAKQTMLAESVMQIVGCYYFGRTADFAAKNGYYYHLHYDRNAEMMYIGALFTLVLTLGSIISLLIALATIIRQEEDNKGSSTLRIIITWTFLAIFGFTALLGRCFFLVGYVRLAGDTYCPPNLFAQGIVWVAMNVAGFALGSGL